MAALLHACTQKSTSNGGSDGGPVPTATMNMDFKVESSEPGKAVARVNLHDHRIGGDQFRLDGKDVLRACLNAVCHDMEPNNSILALEYLARFDYQPGVDYVVSFNRKKGGNAPNSRVALPPSFTVVTPADGEQVTNGDTVMFEWSPTGAPARVYLNYAADCTMASGPQAISGGTLGDDDDADGRELVSISPMVTFTNPVPAVVSCKIDVTVSHEIRGQIDPAFDGGMARGIVSRTTRLNYIPR